MDLYGLDILKQKLRLKLRRQRKGINQTNVQIYSELERTHRISICYENFLLNRVCDQTKIIRFFNYSALSKISNNVTFTKLLKNHNQQNRNKQKQFDKTCQTSLLFSKSSK